MITEHCQGTMITQQDHAFYKTAVTCLIKKYVTWFKTVIRRNTADRIASMVAAITLAFPILELVVFSNALLL